MGLTNIYVFLSSSVNAASPTVKQTIPNQEAHNGESFEMSFLKYGIFADSDGDNLSIDIKQSDDSDLPAWLSASARPLSPSIVGTYDTPGISQGIVVDGDYAYVGDYNSGLQIIDISNSTKPSLVGTCDTPRYAYGVAVDGNYAYVADYDSGLQIIDISNTTNSSIVGTYYTSNLITTSVAVKNNYAYVADSNFGLRIINVGNPSAPSPVGTFPVSGGTNGVAVVGNYAYLITGDSGLQIVDITSPSSPELKGTCDIPGGYGRRVAVLGNYAYIADGTSGLQIIDISDLENPHIVGAYNTPNLVLEVAVVGNYAYVTTTGGTLQIIDVSIPSSPNLVDVIDTYESANGVTIVGNYAYVTDATAGLRIIDGVGGGLRLSGTPGFFDLGTLDLKAIATDGTTSVPTSVSTPFFINVLESTTNNKPTITDQEYKKSQNASLKFNKEQFIAAFQDDDSDELSKIQIMSLPDYGELKLSGIDVSLNQEIDVEDIDDLSYVPEKDWVGTITFEWRGFDGITYSDEEVVTIKISTDWLGAWWPVITGGTVAVITGVVTVAGGVTLWLCRRQLAKCCCNNDLDGSSRDTQLKTIEKDELSD